jgi:hypothetical protein
MSDFNMFPTLPNPAAAAPAAPAPTGKAKKAPKPPKGGYVPLLVDFSLTAAKIIVLTVGLLTAVGSYFAGATALVACGRGCAAIVGLGGLFWLFNWTLANQALESAIAELEEKQKAAAADHPDSTVEVSA